MESSQQKYIAAIDQSTTSTKFSIIDQKGNIVEQTMIEHKQITPQNGWLEHDAIEILQNLRLAISTTLGKVKAEKNISKDQIKAVGVTNQRETVVAWNKTTGIPFYHAIVWNDARTVEICRKYIQKHNGDKTVFSHITGLPINTYFSAFKIRWYAKSIYI